MSEIVWILEDAVYAIHQRQIAEHGGTDGVRDRDLLISALARPQKFLAYGDNASVAQLAASYGFGIAKNHPFLDGNKRTAYVVMRTFLLINGFDIEAMLGEKYLVFLRLAEGSLSEKDLAAWIEDKTLK